MIKNIIKHYLRTGRLFFKYFDELEKTETFSIIEQKEFQNDKLRQIIKVAYQDVPYYRRIFDERKLKPRDIKTIEDLQKLPLIDKQTIKKNFGDFKNKNFKGFTFKGFTSGTTGSPGKFLRDLSSINYENATLNLQFKWANVGLNDRKIWLRGDRIASVDRTKPPFWKLNHIENKLIMSSYHLSDKFMPYYVDKIKEFAPKLLQCYPSTAFVLARYLEKKGDCVNIPVVQTSSEPLYIHWRRLIEERLNTKIFDHYGMAERVCIGLECEAHSWLHLIPGYGITEYIDPKTKTVNKNEGVIVGTTLNNFVMPLIRYQTDDFGKTVFEYCRCGRNFVQIHPVETKMENMIFTKDKRYISPCVVTFCFKDAANIDMSQIVQHKDFSITLKIVKGANFNNKDKEKLLSKLHGILGYDLRIDVEYITHIHRTSSGKYQWIISDRGK